MPTATDRPASIAAWVNGGFAPRVSASPRRAGRPAGNYAHLVARGLGLDLHDVTYSGATTGDILRPSAAGAPAQLEAVTPDTRLVTITAGGNDVGFLPRLTLASLPSPPQPLIMPGRRLRE
jgi:lysophospholipase L1-like esterase